MFIVQDERVGLGPCLRWGSKRGHLSFLPGIPEPLEKPTALFQEVIWVRKWEQSLELMYRTKCDKMGLRKVRRRDSRNFC